MCFSPQADLVGGIVIGAIGIDTVRHRRHNRELALAALPLALASHQIVEAFVWWGLQGRVPADLGRWAMWAYLVFAFCVLPVYVPAAIMAIEPTSRRRRLMSPFLALGIAVSFILFRALLRGPTAVLGAHHIDYQIDVSLGFLVVTLYIVATCGSMLLSGYRHVIQFGAVNLLAAVILAYAATSGFASLWCAWAAVASGAIALHLRYAHHEHRGLRTAPA